MATLESTFGKDFDMKKVIIALMEQDEDVTLDENGETESYWDEILGERKVWYERI